jgi:hypothetical protein
LENTLTIQVEHGFRNEGGHDRSVAEIGLDGAMDALAALIRGFFGYVWRNKYRACFAAN